MPTYLVHGFRWHRDLIRIHIILNHLDDAAANWVMAPATSMAFLASFYELYDFIPQSDGLDEELDVSANDKNGVETMSHSGQVRIPTKFNDWSPVKLLEQHDSEDVVSGVQPYVFVADYAVEVKLSNDIMAERETYEQRNKSQLNGSQEANGVMFADERKHINGEPMGREKQSWIDKLQAKLQENEKVAWYVVVCDDEERTDGVTTALSEAESDEEDDGELTGDEVPSEPNNLITHQETLPHKDTQATAPPKIDNLTLSPTSQNASSRDKALPPHPSPKATRSTTFRGLFTRKSKQPAKSPI